MAATLRCLAEHGAAGASIRRIAAEAGVSTGLINHHYAHLEDLIAEAYESLNARMLRDLVAGVAAAGAAPRARLSAFFRVFFSPAVLDPDYLSAWLVFWSLVRHSAPIKAVHDRAHEAYRGQLEAMLAVLPGWETRGQAPSLAAMGLSALSEGLWLAWCLNPARQSRETCIALCEDWVEAHLR